MPDIRKNLHAKVGKIMIQSKTNNGSIAGHRYQCKFYS